MVSNQPLKSIKNWNFYRNALEFDTKTLVLIEEKAIQ